VDSKVGKDGAAGTKAAPVKTISKAVKLAAAGGTVGAPFAVVLRAGIHFLSTTLQVDETLSGLTIQNYPNEEAFISGGTPITPTWSQVSTSTELPGNRSITPAPNVWKTKLDQLAVPGLNLHTYDQKDPTHARMTRARFPNRQASSGSTQWQAKLGQTGATWLKPKGWGQPGFNVSRTVFQEDPSSDQSAGGSGDHFTYGVGGETCARYTPAGGFWCSNKSTGGGSGWELMVPGAPLFPIGLTVEATTWADGYSAVMPPEPSTWKNKSSARCFVFWMENCVRE
jgi:hypothetical protein